jgi:predicted MFS family arabinose efflux permease
MAIGINGLAGNLGVAVAALITGFLVQWLGWRAAFVVPSLIALTCGLLFMHFCPQEVEPPAKGRSKARVQLPPKLLMRALLVLTMAAVSANMLFNFTTNGNGQLMVERFKGIIEDPATLGTLLAVVYTIGALAQIVVGRLLDRVAVKPLFLTVVVLQIPLLLLASVSHGWVLYVALIGCMAVIFGSIPFVDVVITRYVDDRMRSRVAGLRLAVSLGISALAVWILGPFVKSAGFDSLFMFMALISVCTFVVVLMLPSERTVVQSTTPDGQPSTPDAGVAS